MKHEYETPTIRTSVRVVTCHDLYEAVGNACKYENCGNKKILVCLEHEGKLLYEPLTSLGFTEARCITDVENVAPFATNPNEWVLL